MSGDHRPVATRRVRLTYADTDAAGILYYAAWFPWMERISVEWVLEAGFRYDEMAERYGAVPVARATTCEYTARTSVYDEVDIAMRIEHIGRRSYRLGFTMSRWPDGVVVARSTLSLVFVDGDGVSVPIPLAYRMVLEVAWAKGRSDA